MNLAEKVQAEGICWVDDFVDQALCREIVDELEFALWRDSQVVTRDQATMRLIGVTDVRRRSLSTQERWFSDELIAIVRRIEQRLCEEFGVAPDHLESWQGLRYGRGGKFELHHDAGAFADEPAGERVFTFLLYVRSPKQGGQTYFPEFDRLVPATAGRLLAWQNLLPDGSPDPRMRHAATPVHKGTKVALTTWSRQGAIRLLPPEGRQP